MTAPQQQLAVDRIACDGRGICAELLPEMIRLDDWGFPIIDGRPVSVELLEHARRAVDACPVRALRLERVSAARAAARGAIAPPPPPPVPPPPGLPRGTHLLSNLTEN